MKIKFRKERAIAVFLVFGLLNLQLFDHMGALVSNLNNAFRVLSALGAGILLLRKKTVRVTPLFPCFLLMGFALFISTILNHSNVITCFGRICSLIALALIFEVWSDDVKELILALMPLMELLCYGNYLTILLFPKGMYSLHLNTWSSAENWLLGNRNIMITYLFPACVIAFLYRQYGGKFWRTMGVYFISLLSVTLPPVASSTSTVGIIIFLLMLILIRSGFKFNAYFLLGMNVAAFFAIVVFRMQNWFLGEIVQLLGKNLTFTGRTSVWDFYLQIISAKPLLGYGVMQAIDIFSKFRFTATNAHDMVFQFLYEGGAVQLALYLSMVVIVFKRLKMVQEQNVAQGLGAALFAFQIMGLTEAHQRFAFVFSLYYLAFFADQISKECVTPQQRWHTKMQLKRYNG